MFGMSGTELLIVLVVALLLFGPDKLPEMAKMAGKAMREFQKATGDIRSTVETEFNKLAEIEPASKKPGAPNALKIEPAPGAVATESPSGEAPLPRIAPPGLSLQATQAANPDPDPAAAEKPQP
jgi:TatA/E family protein of Tat protein translocase